VPLSKVTRIEIECSQHSYMTEMTPILNSLQKSKDSLQGRCLPLIVVTSLECESSQHGDMTEMTPILNSVHTYNESL
jgi:hypothetical protein